MEFVDTTMRKGSLPSLLDLLRQQADVKYDVVVPAAKLRYRNGVLHVSEGAATVSDEGVTLSDAMLAPTTQFENGLSQRLDVPRAYLRRMRDTSVMLADADSIDRRETLLDASVNAWLMHEQRTFLVRGFRTDDPMGLGIARAILSDKYATLDNYDVLLAVLAGIQQAGIDPTNLALDADLSETHMRLRVVAPEVTALAPILLANYRSPYAHGSVEGRTGDDGGTFTDAAGNTLPIVQAGFLASNSETGNGAFTLVPRIVVRICNNGCTIPGSALRAVHLGGKLDEGVVQWSEQTQRRALDLVISKARDAVTTFLSAEFVAQTVAELEVHSAAPVSDAPAVIQRIAKSQLFTEAEAGTILDCFVRSGDLTAGGVMQAVTAAAQVVEDPDRAAHLEDSALDVLVAAARA